MPAGEQRLLADAERAQPFGARAFAELQVVGVVHDAAGIGVLVIDADRQDEVRRGGGRGAGVGRGARGSRVHRGILAERARPVHGLLQILMILFVQSLILVVKAFLLKHGFPPGACPGAGRCALACSSRCRIAHTCRFT